jgi:hypothetical protein
MVNARSAILALLFVPFALTYADKREAEARLAYWLQQPDQRGSVFSQGKLDGVDYRKLLRGAVAYDRDSLVGLFRYTAYGKLMGEGAETNSEILHDLLEHWGDARFAAVLSRQPKRVRAAVMAELDYSWTHPGWKPTEFPRTYRLVEHQKIQISKPADQR